jgi:hypothetical protein
MIQNVSEDVTYNYLIMVSYYAYNLQITSDISIPEFIHSDVAIPDVSIRATAPEDIQIDFLKESPYYSSAGGNTFIKIPSIGIFSIRQGREINVVLEDGVDPGRLHLYLTGNIFAFLLLQRGCFVMHASAACVDGKAAAFLGMPGAGKSSLVAALHQNGHTILVDDVSAVDLNAKPVSIIPAFPQIKLDIDAAKSLGIDLETLIPLGEDEEKRGFRFTERFLSTDQPLSKIYILSDQADQVFQRLNSQEAIVELIRNSYPTRFAQAGGASHFLQCVELVKKVPVFRLRRPSTFEGLPELAALLADHIATSSS